MAGGTTGVEVAGVVLLVVVLVVELGVALGVAVDVVLLLPHPARSTPPMSETASHADGLRIICVSQCLKGRSAATLQSIDDRQVFRPYTGARTRRDSPSYGRRADRFTP
jgi:hypothetical protein